MFDLYTDLSLIVTEDYDSKQWPALFMEYGEVHLYAARSGEDRHSKAHLD